MGPYLVPSNAIFAEHGMHNITLDTWEGQPEGPVAGSSHSSRLETWTLGWADLTPVRPYALINRPSTPSIRFGFCPYEDHAAIAQFRRRAQLQTLDLLPSGPGPSRKYGRIKQVVAWWEDSYGLWFLCEADRNESRSLVSVWTETLSEVTPGDSKLDYDKRANHVYGKACEMLVKVVNCLQALRDRDLTLQVCRPASFGFLKALDRFELSRYGEVSPLPPFTPPSLATSSGIWRGGFSDANQHLPEQFLRQNLRYLAPEAAISQRTSLVGDIFSFGVLAYELLTGTMIDGGPESPDENDVDMLADIHHHVTADVMPPLEWLRREALTGSIKPIFPPSQLSSIIMKCLGKDVDQRYSCLEGVAFDLKGLAHLCLNDGDLSIFKLGAADDFARFHLPEAPITRDVELEALRYAFNEVNKDLVPLRVLTVWGTHGCGKTELIRYFTHTLERDEIRCLIGWSPPTRTYDGRTNPLQTFVHIFNDLLSRVLADPKEDAKTWTSVIRDALGNQFYSLLALVGSEYRRLLTGKDSPVTDDVASPNYLTSFKWWSGRFLQLFATPERPLILCIDDAQSMPPDQLSIWREILDASLSQLRHVLVISAFRTESDESPPPASLQLSAKTVQTPVPLLKEADVRNVIKTCLNDAVEDADALASLLFAETQGSSIFVRTVLATLVKEQVVRFDFDKLKWRFDSVDLQKHLSTSGLDAYIQRLVMRLPPDARELVEILSCVQAPSIPVDHLALFVDKPPPVVEKILQTAADATTIVRMSNGRVGFAHEAPKAVVYSMISIDKAGSIHERVVHFVRRPDFKRDMIFEAAEHTLLARKLGAMRDNGHETLELLLDAVARASVSTASPVFERYLDAAEQIIDESGGFEAWVVHDRPSYMRFLEMFTNTAISSGNTSKASSKLSEMAPICDTPQEQIRIATLQARVLYSRHQLTEGVTLAIDTLREQGFYPENPVFHKIKLPRTVAEIEAAVDGLENVAPDKDDLRSLVVSLIGASCTALATCEPLARIRVFELGFLLALDLGRIHDATAYLFASQGLPEGDMELKQAFCVAAKRLILLQPSTVLAADALVSFAAQCHCWLPLSDVSEEINFAYHINIAAGNREMAGYLLGCDLLARVLNSKRLPWDEISKRYDMTKDYAGPVVGLYVRMLLQYADSLSAYNNHKIPWTLSGAILSPEELETSLALPLYKGLRSMLDLRLAILYDASLPQQQAIIHAIGDDERAMKGFLVEWEWKFVKAICEIRKGRNRAVLRETCDALARCPGNKDFADRIIVLEALFVLEERGLESLSEVEPAIDELNSNGRHLLSGMLSFFTAKNLQKTTKSNRICAGFLRAAYVSYRAAEAWGPCQMLQDKYPSISSVPPSAPLSPAEVLGFHTSTLQVPLISDRPSSRTSQFDAQSTEKHSSVAGGTMSALKVAEEAHLDTLTLMRSSLALASESDSSILLCTLLRILCQYVRSDYAAVALCDEGDRTSIHLRAAGPHSRILPYELEILDEEAQTLCPVSIMLHSARTGKPITSLSNLSRLRLDPFYQGRQPRKVLCLPILTQGDRAGVVLLSSLTDHNLQAPSTRTQETVSALATFATIVTSNFSFTRRLKLEVDQRTKELTSALAAKSRFLSQCSHELRSPLSAVLGLSAVLEASPGLSQVQREHLRTIISSGEDLLGLINNILDHSRLESGSVTLEQIPFDFRELAEDALDTVAAVAQKKDLELCMTTSVKDDPPPLIGDPFRIKQILMNLLSNATKFTEKGGILVDCRYEMVGEGRVRVTVAVSDTGIGIPARKMNKLFHSFSQVDESITRSFGGSGLGLIISKDLAKLLGGDCIAESEYGKGSTFTFSFVTIVNPQKQQRGWRPLQTAKRCFVICPEGPWWDMMNENFEALNCRPVRFSEDVDLCLVPHHPSGLDSGETFDFIFLDNVMMSEEVVARMRKLQPNAKIIFLVRSLDLAQVMKSFEVDRKSIVSRPIKFRSLYEALVPDSQDLKPVVKKPKPNKELSKQCPLDVLLVDDNQVNLTVGRRILEMFGYNGVDTAQDGQQALDKAEAKHYDLILLDLQMPVMDGFSAQAAINVSSKAGNPCVVALTANADKATQQVCEEADFFDYLSKPLDIPRLGKILERVYNARHPQKIENGQA